jgi:RNA recognition motif-containing protein
MEIYIVYVEDSASEETVKQLFRRYGQVKSVRILKNRDGSRTGRCFVDMPNEDEAEKAIAALNGTEFQGRKLMVQKALTKAQVPETE